MVNTVSDRRYKTKFVKDKLKQYKFNVANADKSWSSSTSALLAEATAPARRRTMEAQARRRLIFINCMEKLTMNAPKETLRVRMRRRWTPASTASRWPPACTWARSR
jgi:nitronate monooxygenase